MVLPFGYGTEDAPRLLADRQSGLRRAHLGALVSACEALLVFVSDHGVNAVPQASPLPDRRGARADFLRVELRVQHATVHVDAIRRDAAAICFAGNECDAPVIPLAPPDADLPFWNSELTHSLLDVGFGHVRPLVR